ncbi:transcriptional regulator, LysR family protein [Pseudomonas sp. M47T1]|uniref:LysR family transcriptional regulator n=1 Tax=Pseudomonas sp. M47T1 TaxID=1179778 RepID=UPI00026080EE|nr:LysR family transcriptional regulator [Pseudomonas sp. M47T1]EIK93459.1 transcriptional regulator, LysR family protein [Pseudomonas sp. M47T1]
MTDSIDLRQFRYFVALSETLNFGRAAARLFICQPPLSRQIRQLEDDLGVALFERTRTGVVLTAAGAAFLPEARRTLAQAQKAIASAKSAGASAARQFVIGYTTVLDRSAFPDVVAALQGDFPDCRIVVKGKHSVSLVRDIKNGVMDAAFIGLHTDARGLVQQTLIEEPMLAALPARHPLARKRQLGFDDLASETIFDFERRLNPGFHDYCQAFFQRIGFTPATLPEPADHHILLGMIAEGQGIALIPASLQNVKRQGVAFRRLKPREGGLTAGVAVTYADDNASPVLRAFLERVRLTRGRPPGAGDTAVPGEPPPGR